MKERERRNDNTLVNSETSELCASYVNVRHISKMPYGGEVKNRMGMSTYITWAWTYVRRYVYGGYTVL